MHVLINDLLAGHRLVIDASVAVVSRIQADDLGRPTPCAEWTLADLLAHKHDAYLHKQAALIKAFKHPVFIRLDHEFNWTRSPFYTPNGADFITLWRYIVDLFRADGATNATWVWCPNQVVIGEDLSKLYPGDSYVDWTAVDTYNWGNLVKWQTFAQIMDVSYGALLQVAPSKPIFLAETASDDRGGDKAAWITDWLLTMAVRYPSLRAFTYFPCVTGVEHWPMAAADIAAYVQGLKAGPYPLVGAYPMPPDLTPILPLQAASWGNQVAPLQAQGVLDRASIASLQSQVIVANTATGVANTATGVANAAAASTQATLDQAQADVAAVIKFGQPGPTVP